MFKGFDFRKTAAIWIAAGILMCAQPGHADLSAGQQADGRLIFSAGERRSGEPLTANVGAASIPVPATALPCAGCHGRDGRGRPEGGVRPSDITWFNLSREYGGKTVMGRHYDAYDEDSFLRAVTIGIDSAGNALDSSMPRYNLSRRDARDLIAYLELIQNDNDPGISEKTIVIGTLQPQAGSHARAGNAMIEVIRACFAEVNGAGGLYGRQLELRVAPFADQQEFVTEADRMADGDEVFALLSAYSSTADETLGRITEQSSMPSIAPYTQFPVADGSRNYYTFYLHGGLEAQISALAKRVADQAAGAPAYVLYARDGAYQGMASAALDRLREAGFVAAQSLGYGAGDRLSDLVDPLPDSAPSVLFVGPSRDLLQLLDDDAARDWQPRLYLPGYFVGADILDLSPPHAERLEMTYISVLGGDAGKALEEFKRFMKRNGLTPDYLNARLYAYGASQVLIEGIKKSGKRITRKDMAAALEQLYGFDAGLNRPVNFTSQNRVGIRGAFVVRLEVANRRLAPTDIWVGVE